MLHPQDEESDLLKCDEPLDNIDMGQPTSSGYYEQNLDYMSQEHLFS